jgi:hypothetical protein
MPINTSTFVLAAIAENAAGVPQQKALPIALFASTLRPMTGLLFALLLGKSALGSSPSSTNTPAPTPIGTGGTGAGGTGAGGTGGSGSGGSGSGGSGGRLTVPSTIPPFLHMPKHEAEAWAHIIGLTPKFHPEFGRMVIHQTPQAGALMPTGNPPTVHLQLGEEYISPENEAS